MNESSENSAVVPSEVAPNPPPPVKAAEQAKFLTGSTLKHVLKMTITGAIGLVAVFAVDMISLLYVTMLGKQELTAALGYASTLLFFALSLGIGMSVATSALTSVALGRGDRHAAIKMASSSLVIMTLGMSLFAVLIWPFIDPLLALIGAKGDTAVMAREVMLIVLPSFPLLGLGMAFSSLLRAVGDARRAMWVTLMPALALLVIDPLLIFGLGLELKGAAWATVCARLIMTIIGWYGLIHVHKLFKKPDPASVLSATKQFFAIGIPAMLTQIATPFANAYVTEAMAQFGDDAVAGSAIVNRLSPVAFGLLFSLSAAVGPIIGQNMGGRQFDRVRSTVKDSLKVVVVYCLGMSLLLALLAPWIATAFGAQGQAAEVVIFFCRFVAISFVFSGMLFVANAAFNNLGYPLYSTTMNWGRATLGVIPFVYFGGLWFGPQGVIAGSGLGTVAFGLLSIWLCLRTIKKVNKDSAI